MSMKSSLWALLGASMAFGANNLYTTRGRVGSSSEDRINKKLHQLGMDARTEEDPDRFTLDFLKNLDSDMDFFLVRGWKIRALNQRNAEKRLTKMLKDNGYNPFITFDEFFKEEINEEAQNTTTHQVL